MSDAKQVGQILRSPSPAPATAATASPALSIAASELDLTTLPARLDDTTLALVKEIAGQPLPALSRCDDRTFLKCFRVMQASLPRRGADELSGELLTAAYERMLGHLPEGAILFISEQALSSCKWFPTVAECLEIAGRWKRNDAALRRRNKARSIVSGEQELRMAEIMGRLARRELSQEEIDALPEGVKRIASERCYLWWHADGSFTVRFDATETLALIDGPLIADAA